RFYPQEQPGDRLVQRLAHWLAATAGSLKVDEVALEACSIAEMLVQALTPLMTYTRILILPAHALRHANDARRLAVTREYSTALAAHAEREPSFHYSALSDVLWSCLEKPSDYSAMKSLL